MSKGQELNIKATICNEDDDVLLVVRSGEDPIFGARTVELTIGVEKVEVEAHLLIIAIKSVARLSSYDD